MDSTSHSSNQIHEAYEDVRADDSATEWAVFKYETNGDNGKDMIVCADKGSDYDTFKDNFKDDDRVFGFVRIITGDELSKRPKFALINWVGSKVSPLKKAKMSTDKSLVKKIIKSFAVEVVTDELPETDESYIRDLLIKAGGASYGTGTRD